MNVGPLSSDPQNLLRHRAWVRGVARALVSDENLAADLEQNLWLRTLSRPPRFRRSVRGWLAKGLRSALLDHRRGEARRERREREAAVRRAKETSVESPDQVVAKAEVHRRVVEAVLHLPEPYRVAILLRYFDELLPAEMAVRLDVPVETARTRVKRAITMLRDAFDRQEGGNRRAWSLALLPVVRWGDALSTSAATTAAASSAAVASGAVVMTSKIVTVAAITLVVGAGVGWFAAVGRESSEEAIRKRPATRAPAPRLGGAAVTLAGNTDAIAELQQSVARLEAVVCERNPALVLDPEARKTQALQRLEAIEHRERQTAMHDAVGELASIGEPVVADVVELLKSGLNRDWGRFSWMDGNVVKSYGRFRAMLMDVLRQIGTKEAKEGLLAAVGASHDLRDYENLLQFYDETQDPLMRERITGLMPKILGRIAEVGLARTSDATWWLTDRVDRWIRASPTPQVIEALAVLLEKTRPDAFAADEFMKILIHLDPERAAAVVEDGFDRNPDAPGWFGFVPSGYLPNGRIVPYLNGILSRLRMTEAQRGSLYESLEPALCHDIEDLKERAADGKQMLRFLERRLEAESGGANAEGLTYAIEDIREQIKTLGSE